MEWWEKRFELFHPRRKEQRPAGMIDDRNESVDVSGAAKFELPPPAHFDESACESAQPVQAIHVSRVAGWIQRASDARQALTLRTKTLALVLVGALAIGTLGGTMLLREGKSTDPSTVAEHSNVEPAAPQDAPQESGPDHATRAAQASSIMALQDAVQNPPRIRRERTRPRMQQGPKAYRVAVIR